MPGDIRQHALQNFCEIAVVPLVAFAGPICVVPRATWMMTFPSRRAARVVEASSNGCFTPRSSSTVPMPLCTSKIGVVSGRIPAVLYRIRHLPGL